MVPFLGHQPAMPAQNGVRRDQRAEFAEQFAAQDFPFDGQPVPLVVIQQNSFLAMHLLKHLVLGAKILDYLLLLLVHPASQDRQQQLPSWTTKLMDAPVTGAIDSLRCRNSILRRADIAFFDAG